MTTKTIKLIAFIVLLVHGIGHLQGVAASIGLKINNARPAISWLFKSHGERINRIICFVLFFISAICGISTALSFNDLFLEESVWKTLAVITSVFSTICLIVFPNGFAMFFNKVGAIAVNLIIYYSIVFRQHWPDVLFED